MARTPMKKFFQKIRKKLPTKAMIAGAVQGVIGDKLPRRLAPPMRLFWRGGALESSQHINRPHACIFVHGSADSEAGWQANPPEASFGDGLLLDFGVEPLYLRYNSGLSVAENGLGLSSLLDAWLGRNPGVKRISFVAHSMGGLVVHSAIYHARTQKRAWVKKIRQVILLGTPHRGAPLAKLADKSEQLLQFIPNPVSLIAASVINLRSRGLKDLSHGGMPASGEKKILLPGVRYVFVAGGLQKKPGGILNRLLGDGMVRKGSAHIESFPEKNWLQKAFPWINRSGDIRLEYVPGISHLGLRNSPAVYAVITRNFKS